MVLRLNFRNPVRGQWWQSRLFLALVILAAAIPLIAPAVPPLVDLPGHMGRYRVQLNMGESAALARYFGFQWAVIGNLGIDLLIEPLGRLFGLEPAVKMIVLAIPPLTVAGLLWIAHEIHGRIPATAFFALPLAYGYPFQFGFANFALSAAFALIAFALWIRMGRKGRERQRAILFVPIGALIWLTHTFGWGLLGLLAFATETASARERGHNYFAALVRGGLACLPLAPPVALMLLWRSGQVAGSTGDWFNWYAKGRWLVYLLRERWEAWDVASALLVMALPLTAIFWTRIRFSHKLGLATLFLMLAFIGLPRILLGSAYADMRLAPFLFAVAIIAIAPVGEFAKRWSGAIAIFGIAFFAARIAVSTAAFADVDRGWQAQLAAVPHIAEGSRVLALAETPCNEVWDRPRFEHLTSFATIRRDAFVNDQWVMPGAQLLRVRYRDGEPFADDPSQILRPPECQTRREGSIAMAMQVLPRGAFDHFWLIGVGPADWPSAPFLQPVWQGERGVLYRVVGTATNASDTPNGSDARPIA
ncbi:hypothetical protein [Allosphingosinicella indica]|uniref:Glycosyltransferase RgtA/B/C/D-like domain-containing protein n=1 Tax=Allosphingosinicella indica TaxID=941907 RepID=A0A1X7GBP0_9SPHN|nr:hypothetical protein [Allosphingosinicella indica]SMF67143.1 hypothetical protein SAMN06295910_1468 [Allosphingosinicella indica]